MRATVAGSASRVRQHAPQGAERRREIVTFWAYRAAESIIGRLPRGLLLAVAGAVGNVAYDLAEAQRAVVHANLSRALGRPPDDRRVARAARRAFRNYARYLVDMLRLSSLRPADVDRIVALDNVDRLREAQAGGRGVLLCTAHVGSMDLLAPALHSHGERMHVVAEDTAYGRLYEHLRGVRGRHGVTLIGWRNLRALIRALRAGENLVLFCDGGYRRGDVPVELLGEATTFPAGPAALSARSGATLLPVASRRMADDRVQAHALPAVHPASADPADLYRATQAVADALGGFIAADPAQWYMFRPVWPQTDADREHARRALAAARRGEDWTKV